MKKLSFIITVLISMAVLSSFDQPFDQPFDLKASMERGKSVYLTYCMSCHMMEGQGVEGVFSPMAKNPNLALKDKTIQIVLKGIRGPVTVNNKTYPGDMAPVSLSDEQTADLLNYIRNSWGNKGAPVLPKDIQPALKVELKDYKPY
jgi:mono/diheme cytochrome c family protein